NRRRERAGSRHRARPPGGRPGGCGEQRVMIQKKPTLGRGLADLLGQVSAPRPVPPPATSQSEAVPQPAAVAGEELAASIKAQGVVQPIVVRPIAAAAAGESPRYEIIAGERRWRAAQIAGLADIPAVIRHIPDEAAIAVALIENIQRESLNPLEEARALERLITEFELTHAQAADAVGRSRAAVSNLLRLLELAPEVGALVERRELEMGHARALLALSSRRQQAEVATIVAKRGLSVRDTEALVRRLQHPVPSSAEPAQAADADVRRLEQDLADKLGAKVLIQHSRGGKGKLVVSYNSLDELDGILAHIT